MHSRTRIVIIEDGADLLREAVTREPIPSTDTTPWAGTGPGRGEWEAECSVNDGRAAIQPGRAA